MSIYIPLLLLYVPVFVVTWLAFGLMWRTITFMLFPGVPLGLDQGAKRKMLLWGPLGCYMIFALWASQIDAKLTRADWERQNRD